MATGYRFDEFTPEIGEEVHCFKTFDALKDFVDEQDDEEEFEDVKFWKIHGDIIADEGGDDGWIIKVEDYDEIDLDD